MSRTVGQTHGRTVAFGATWLVLLCACATVRLCAQTLDTIPKPRVPSYVRYGKWIALGGAAFLGYKANQAHQDANDSYDTLRERCFDVPLSCSLQPDGHYSDPVSEGLYTDTRNSDHRASRYLIGAEVSFAAAAVGFVWELLRREDRTPNIPFEPRVETTARETRVGMSLRF